MSKLEEIATEKLLTALSREYHSHYESAVLENKILRHLFRQAMRQRLGHSRIVRKHPPMPEIILRKPGDPFSRIKIKGDWS